MGQAAAADRGSSVPSLDVRKSGGEQYGSFPGCASGYGGRGAVSQEGEGAAVPVGSPGC